MYFYITLYIAIPLFTAYLASKPSVPFIHFCCFYILHLVSSSLWKHYPSHSLSSPGLIWSDQPRDAPIQLWLLYSFTHDRPLYPIPYSEIKSSTLTPCYSQEMPLRDAKNAKLCMIYEKNNR